MSGLSKSDHINAAETLLEEWKNYHQEFSKDVELIPDEEINLDDLAIAINAGQLILQAAQVHATLANAMRP